ncbi:MAG TPA: ATPase, T2SS/T4P/T4SS family, partial [Actinomycetes bacterium]|nr:ATPase, T2SS/T4P/T4SS family [Actinomycetes bacterium]
MGDSVRLGKHAATDPVEPVPAVRDEWDVKPPDDLTVVPGGSRFGELLVDEQLLIQSQVVEALVQQGPTGKRLGQLLVELGALDERDLARTLARQHALEFVDLRQANPDGEATQLLPESVARSLCAIPMTADESTLVVAVADPGAETAAELSKAAGRPVILLVGATSEIMRAIESSYRATAAVSAQVQAFEARDSLRKAAATAQRATANDDAPVVQVVNLAITQGLRDRASDIHIEPQDDRIRVRYRIDGALHDVLSLPASIGPALVSRIKIMGAMNIVERRRPQDGQIAMDLDGRPVDIRVSTTATIWGEKVVMRLLDK